MQAEEASLLDGVPFVVYRCAAAPPYGETFISAHVQRHFGWSPQRFYDDPGFWRSIIHGDDRAAVDAAMQRVREQGEQVFEYRVRHADGRWIWCRDHAQCVGSGAEACITGSWFDIDAEVRERERAAWRGEQLAAIGRAQAAYIGRSDSTDLFRRLLDDLRALSGSGGGALIAGSDLSADAAAWQLLAEHWPEPTLGGRPYAPLDPQLRAALGQPAPVHGLASTVQGTARHWVAVGLHHRQSALGLLVLGGREQPYPDSLLDDLDPILTTLGQLIAADHAAGLRRREREERERLAMVLARLDSAVLIADGDDRICWINEGFTRLTGYLPEQALGALPSELLAGTDSNPAEIARMAACLEQSRVYEGEILNYRCDGSRYWARLRIEPLLEDGTRRGYIAMQTDISEEHAERARRQELAERLQKLSRRVPGMLFQLEMRADGRTRFPWSSEGIRDLFGLDTAAVATDASRLFERVHADDRARLLDSLQQSRRSLQVWHGEFRVLHPLRGERTLLGNASPERLADASVLWHGHLADITERKRSEQAEQRARAQLQQLIDAATEVAVIATDLDGTIRVFNRGAENMLGYEAADLVGRASPALFHDPAEVDERGRQLSLQLGRPIAGFETFVWSAREGRPEQRLWTYRRADGERLQVSLSVSAVHDAQGRLSGFLGVATDRTRQLQAEQALRASELKFRNLYESANLAILRSRLGDGRILEANRALQSITGYRSEEHTGLHESDLVPEDRRGEFAREAEELHWHGRCGPFVSQLRRRDGRRIDVLVSRVLDRDPDGSEVAWTMVQDISAHKRTEAIALESARALAQNVERTRIILDNTADGILSCDERGHIESINRAALSMFGRHAEQIEGHSIAQLLPLASSEQAGHRLAELATDAHGSSEWRAQRGDGREFDVELGVTRVERKEGPLYVCVLRDITERKQVELMKNQFIATVSHELRTPLTSVRGAIGLVAGGGLGTLPGQAGELLKVALRNIERLTQLINDLLDMEKLLAGELSIQVHPCTLAELAKQAVELNRGLEQAHTIRLQLQVDSAAMVAVDPDRLLQVLANLISNAAKFSPRDGVVELRVTELGDWVRVAVRDHGPGVPVEFQRRLFQKFSQADSSDTRRVGGTGLGLAISRELVQRMGGRIGFDSPPGQGATFWCDFPAHVEAAAAPELQLDESRPPLARVLSRWLRDCGLRCPDPAAPATAADPGATVFIARCIDPTVLPAQTLDAAPRAPRLLLAVAEADIARAQSSDPAPDWQPAPLPAAAALELIRALLDAISDRPGRVLLLSAAQATEPQPWSGLARARIDRVGSHAEARRLLRQSVYDLLVIDLAGRNAEGALTLAEVRRIEPVPPVLAVVLAGAAATPSGVRPNAASRSDGEQR